jgi:lysozyme
MSVVDDRTANARSGALERYRLRLGFWQAVWGTLITGGVAVAIPVGVEAFKIHSEEALKQTELILKDRESNEKNISSFLNTALNQDIELRIRFAEYLSFVSNDEKKKDWLALLKSLRTRREQAREEINAKQERVLRLGSNPYPTINEQIELARAKRELEWNYAEVGYAQHDTNVTAPKIMPAYSVSNADLTLPAARVASNFPIHGIDVSKYNGDIDWKAVANAGMRFVFIKATEGLRGVDHLFFQNWTGANDAGIPRGAYFFVDWCTPFDKQVAWFESQVPVVANALPPVIDAEMPPESSACKKTLSPKETVATMLAMIGEMEHHYGKRPIIYTTVDFFNAILVNSDLPEYPIWVRSTKYHPSMRYNDRQWLFWQVSSSSQIAGIHGTVDENAFIGDEKAWKLWLEVQKIGTAPLSVGDPAK